MTHQAVRREDSPFMSDGKRCAAWLYRPHGAPQERFPIVVMAHGFAAQRSFRLPEYAIKFAERGMAVLLFDYRHFGDSEGEPRDMVDHRRQHRDWIAAVEHAKTIEGIDGERVALWGSSFSGGHVISVAARLPDVRAVVSQVPMLNVMKSIRSGLIYMARAVAHGLTDYGCAIVGRSPHYVPTVALPGHFAALNKEGCDTGYRSVIPPDADWKNRVTARSLLSSTLFRPSRDAAAVDCPVLFVIAEKDQLIRTRVSMKVTAKVRQATVLKLPIDHFEVYHGEVYTEVSDQQADFLARHLSATAP